MKKSIKILSILLLFSVLNGCSSLRAKKEGFGASYEGAAYSFDSMSCLLSNKSTSKTENIILVPISTVDLVMSSALDTVFLPIDLMASKKDAKQFRCTDLLGN